MEIRVDVRTGREMWSKSYDIRNLCGGDVVGMNCRVTCCTTALFGNQCPCSDITHPFARP